MNQNHSGQPVVDLRQIIKRYTVGEREVIILNQVSVTIGGGEFVSIVGPSGSGKSTLLNMITGIDHADEGEVMVLGYPVHAMSENELARWRGEHVGIIFQFFQLLPALSLLKNVMLPMDLAGKYRPTERRTRAAALLEAVGLADQMNKLPGAVSGGQMQRAAIARALANDPPLLVADEPTGNLDSAAAEKVFALFNQLVTEGKTMIMVTHDKELASQAVRQIRIMDGNIFENGSNHGRS